MRTPTQRHVGEHLADVDERQVLLEPEARFELLRDDARRVAASPRRAPSARAARPAARRTRRPGTSPIASGMPTRSTAQPTCDERRAGRAHHRVLGIGDELRDREQRADQRRDGEQLVEARRQVQRDEQQRARRSCSSPRPTSPSSLIRSKNANSIDQRDEDQQRREQHLAADVALQRASCGHAGCGGRAARRPNSPVTESWCAKQQEHDAAAR